MPRELVKESRQIRLFDLGRGRRGAVGDRRRRQIADERIERRCGRPGRGAEAAGERGDVAPVDLLVEVVVAVAVYAVRRVGARVDLPQAAAVRRDPEELVIRRDVEIRYAEHREIAAEA